MALRFSKMNGFIFGFHRFVWWPKWTPASSSSGTSSIVLDIGCRDAGRIGAADGEDATPLSLWQPEFRAPPAWVLPFGIAVRNELLEDGKTHFAIVQGIAKLSALKNPSGRDPTQR